MLRKLHLGPYPPPHPFQGFLTTENRKGGRGVRRITAKPRLRVGSVASRQRESAYDGLTHFRATSKCAAARQPGLCDGFPCDMVCDTPL
jgi:hypothetical protein